MFQQASLQMEWCLDCHRAPEQYLRPREAVFDMNWQPEGDQLELGPPTQEGIPNSRHVDDDELFDVPPVVSGDGGQGRSCFEGRGSRGRRGQVEGSSDLTIPNINLAAVRARLASSGGKTYWRSLEELANTDEFQDYLHREFPSLASEFTDPVGRRQFLRLMGASLALAGAGACTRQPAEEIVPYVQAPEQIVPGRPLFFATAMPLDGFGTGMLVENHMGRPTKIEGNPDHPASLGVDRRATPRPRSSGCTIPIARRPHAPRGRPALGRIARGDADGDGDTTPAARRGPAHPDRDGHVADARPIRFAASFATCRRRKWHQYDPVSRDAERAGARLAFGTDVSVHYQRGPRRRHRFARRRFPGARDRVTCAYARRVLQRAGAWTSGGAAMNRLYASRARRRRPPRSRITGSRCGHRRCRRLRRHSPASLGVTTAPPADASAWPGPCASRMAAGARQGPAARIAARA